MSGPPIARALILTDDGVVAYSPALALFDGAVAGLSLTTTRSDSSARSDAVPGFMVAAQAIAATLSSIGA